MPKFASHLLKRLLKRFNRVLSYSSYPVSGCHFPDDLRWVVGLPDPVCFDVGAHWGETIRALKEIFERPVIHSFEPTAESLQVLRKLHAPPAVHVHALALGDTDGRATMRTYEDSVLNSFLDLDPEGPQKKIACSGSEEVETLRLDTFVRTQGIPVIHLLKIDTQGHELAVLQGAAESLRSGVVPASRLADSLDDSWPQAVAPASPGEQSLLAARMQADLPHASAAFVDALPALPDCVAAPAASPRTMVPTVAECSSRSRDGSQLPAEERRPGLRCSRAHQALLAAREEPRPAS